MAIFHFGLDTVRGLCGGSTPSPVLLFRRLRRGCSQLFPFVDLAGPRPCFFRPCGAAFVGLPGRPRPLSAPGHPLALSGSPCLGPTGQFTLPHPGFSRLRRRGRFQLFSREKSCKSTHKGASPLRNPLIFLMRTRRHRLVLSPDSANCGAAGQKRLPLRRALWAYPSFGLGDCRSIHMKCGCDIQPGPSLPPQFLWKENR